MHGKGSNHKFALWVARRYLFSKKSHNAINIISAISAAGVMIGTATLIAVLSVFNGFEELVQGMFSAFDPDLKISLTEGKSFRTDSPEFEQIKSHPSVVNFAEVVEETALLSHEGRQTPVTVMGVGPGFRQITSIENILYDGSYLLQEDTQEFAVIGVGIAINMGISPHLAAPVQLYAPKRTEKINIVRPDLSFNSESPRVAGIFVVNQAEYDDQKVLVSIDLARKLYEFDGNSVSNLQLKLASGAKLKSVKKEFEALLGSQFKVQNKYEQQEDFFKITKIEKWITYLILIFILMIATFNIIGSLSMLIMEKNEDIEVLRNLGASENLIKRIFLFEGWLITAAGALIGVVLGVTIILVQQHFGLLKLGGDNYIVEAYPVILSLTDVLISVSTVLLMGLFAAVYPVRYIKTN